MREKNKILKIIFAEHMIVAFFFIALLALTISGIHRLNDIANELYTHTFIVNNASLKIQADIMQMRNNVLEIAHTTDAFKIGQLSKEIEVLNREVNTEFEILEKYFSGDKERLRNLIEYFDKWQNTRKTIIDLMRNGQKESAIFMTLNYGREAYIKIFTELSYVVNFTQSNAVKFVGEGNELTRRKTTYIWVLISVLTLLVSIISIIVIRFIISELNRGEKAAKELEQSERKFRIFFESAKDLILFFDKSGHILNINPNGHRQLGYTKEEMLGKHITQFISPEAAKRAPENMARLLAEGNIIFESTIMHKNGSFLQMEINAQKVILDGHELVFSIHRDISERKKIEKILSEREAKYRAVIETLGDGFWILDRQGNILEVNDAYVKRSCYSREELLRMNVRDIASKETPEEMAAHFQKIINNGHDRFESYHITKNGQQWPVEIVTNFSNIMDGRFFVFIQDLTTRNQILKELEQSKLSMQKVLDNAPIGMALARPDGRLVYVNDTFCSVLRYSREELEKLTIMDITYTDDHTLTSGYVKELLSETISVYSGEKRYICKDGRIIWAHLTGCLHKDPMGEVFMIAHIEDITERKIFDEKLKESEKKFRIFFESASDCIIIFAKNGRILDINTNGYMLFGYTKEEMVGKHVTEFARPEVAKRSPENMLKLFNEGYILFESVVMHKNGDEIPVEINARVFVLDGQEMIFSIHRDITERKQTLKKLQESESKFRLLFENADDFLMVINMNDGCILDLNPATFKRLEYSKEEMTGMHISKLVSAQYNSGLSDRMDKIKSKGYYTFESEYLTKSGTRIPVEVNVHLIEKDGQSLAFSIARDFTERKKMEKAMHDREALSRAVIERILDS